jgi:hypothetical protein
MFGISANAFGAALQFTAGTTANVTALTLNDESDFTFSDAAFNVASNNAAARIVDLTLAGTGLATAGVTRLLILLDDSADAAISTNDTIINITGFTGSLASIDFFFG